MITERSFFFSFLFFQILTADVNHDHHDSDYNNVDHIIVVTVQGCNVYHIRPNYSTTQRGNSTTTTFLMAKQLDVYYTISITKIFPNSNL